MGLDLYSFRLYSQFENPRKPQSAKDLAKLALSTKTEANNLNSQAQGADNLGYTSQADKYRSDFNLVDSLSNFNGTLAVVMNDSSLRSKVDLNNDNKLSYNEVVRMDKNGDGTLDSADFKVVFGDDYQTAITVTQSKLNAIANNSSSSSSSSSSLLNYDVLGSLLDGLSASNTNGNNLFSQLVNALLGGGSQSSPVDDPYSDPYSDPYGGYSDPYGDPYAGYSNPYGNAYGNWYGSNGRPQGGLWGGGAQGSPYGNAYGNSPWGGGIAYGNPFGSQYGGGLSGAMYGIPYGGGYGYGG